MALRAIRKVYADVLNFVHIAGASIFPAVSTEQNRPSTILCSLQKIYRGTPYSILSVVVRIPRISTRSGSLVTVTFGTEPRTLVHNFKARSVS